MQKKNTPVRLWCLCYEYLTNILYLLSTRSFDIQGRSPYEVVMHYTPDILEYVSYTWLQWCWYFDEYTKNKKLCYWLGPARQVGQEFCSYIILDNAQHIARFSVIGVLQDELLSDHMKEETKKIMTSLEPLFRNYR